MRVCGKLGVVTDNRPPMSPFVGETFFVQAYFVESGQSIWADYVHGISFF